MNMISNFIKFRNKLIFLSSELHIFTLNQNPVRIQLLTCEKKILVHKCKRFERWRREFEWATGTETSKVGRVYK